MIRLPFALSTALVLLLPAASVSAQSLCHVVHLSVYRVDVSPSQKILDVEPFTTRLLNYGGTFDGSGAVFSEAYDHQWVDNEFLELAKRRGKWAFAERSVVEHLHPVWGLAEWDDTYNKAFRETTEDQALFARRQRLMQAGVR